jgi:monomeric isocitrate dehydrogenase
MEKLKSKVAQAISKRAEGKVNDAANEMRKAVNSFCEKFGVHDKKRADVLRALADNIEGKTSKWIIPQKIFDIANEQAFEEFRNQFDALTRFVNQGINCVDAGIEAQEPTDSNG